MYASDIAVITYDFTYMILMIDVYMISQFMIL